MKVLLTEKEIDYIFKDMETLAKFTLALHKAKDRCGATTFQFDLDYESKEGENNGIQGTQEQ